MRVRKTNLNMLTWIALIGGAMIALFFIGKLFVSSPKQQASKVVTEFYSYEQQGDFSTSWSLFHPYMQDKFPKGHYIQDRAHVFMNHFGVETFTFQQSKPTKIDNWIIDEDALPIDKAYSITVIQTYSGKYGNFDIVQEVFAVKEEGAWKIAWNYN